MSFFPHSRLAAVPSSLSPLVWSGEELAAAPETVLSTGFDALDAVLPGAGWPVGSLVELLQAHEGQHAWQLLAPGLAAQKEGPVVLVGAPFQPFGPALAARGLPAQRLLCVAAARPAERLWACEQCLRCADVAAVLAWLPQARSAELRRLHMAAQQHAKLLFVFRRVEARNEASPARLRLLLEGTDMLRIHILKRRGPPVQAPVLLPAWPPRLASLLQARSRRDGKVPAAGLPSIDRSIHALDRTSAFH